MIARFE